MTPQLAPKSATIATSQLFADNDVEAVRLEKLWERTWHKNWKTSERRPGR